MPSLPAGSLAVPPIADALATHRATSFAYELRGLDLAPTGDLLDGVEPGGFLEWSAARTVKGVGRITVTDIGQEIDWRTVRIAPTITVNAISWPLGLWVPVLPNDAWDEVTRTWQVGLLDVTAIMDRGGVHEPFSLPAGTVVTDAIADLISSTGLPYAVTPSTATLAIARVWEAGTSPLRIANELTEAINYFALYADDNGVVRANPYVAPQSRPVSFQFIDGDTCIYEPRFGRERDEDSVPTEVILTTHGTDTESGLYAVFEAPADSPYSQEARGYDISYSEMVRDVVDLETLQARARTRWIDLASPQSVIPINHLAVPLRENQAGAFRSRRADIDGRVTVLSTRLTLDAFTGAATRLREVVPA